MMRLLFGSLMWRFWVACVHVADALKHRATRGLLTYVKETLPQDRSSN